MEKPLLKDLNLSLQAGERCLIMGPSGSGKSTLIETLMGEKRALAGQVNYAKRLLEKPSSIFALVAQHPFIFDESLRFNLDLGRGFSDEELMAVLKAVELPQFATPEGLEVNIGENKAHLSGGEIKRLELARALLAKRPILVVDEALSGLDKQRAATLHDLIVSYPGTLIEIEHYMEDGWLADYQHQLEMDAYQIASKGRA